MKATIFKIALLIIAIIVGFMYYGCESNPINPVEKDRSAIPLMETTIYTETFTQKYTTQNVFYSDGILNVGDTSGYGESYQITDITGFEIYPLPYFNELPFLNIAINMNLESYTYITTKVSYWDYEGTINVDDTLGCGESFPLNEITSFEIYPLTNKIK